jgi:hypothetical protein
MDEYTASIINKIKSDSNYTANLMDDFFYLSTAIEILYYSNNITSDVYKKLKEKLDSVYEAVHFTTMPHFTFMELPSEYGQPD